jgi:hypothetical protein
MLGGERLDDKIKNKDGTRSGKKRVVTMAAMLLLLILSSLSILAFFLKVETKKTLADDGALSADLSADDYAMPRDAEEPLASSDTPSQRRQLLTDELNSLLAETEARAEGTDDDSVGWIYDKTTPSALTTSNFYVYLGRGDDAFWGRFFAGYVSEAPVSANRIILDVDGTIYDIGIKHGDRGQRCLDYIKETHEFVDMPVDDYADILRHVGNGRNVLVRFQGGENEHHFRLSFTQIDAVARMMRILRVSEELSEAEKSLTTQ